MLEWKSDIRCHGLMSYYNISYNKLKGKKDFIGNESRIQYDGSYKEKGIDYDEFTIYDDKEYEKQNYYDTFRVIGGVDALPASDDTVNKKHIQRITSLEERLGNSICSVQGGASRRRNAKRHGKNRRTRHKTCHKTCRKTRRS